MPDTHTASIRGRIVSAWDLDKNVGSNALYYQDDDRTGFGRADVTDETETRWIDAITSDVDDVVLDVPGGKVGALYGTFQGSPGALIEFVRECHRRPIIVIPIAGLKDSLSTIFDSIELFRGLGIIDQVDIVVILNGKFGPESDFSTYNGREELGEKSYGRAREMMNAIKAHTIYLPPLAHTTIMTLDDRELSYTAALQPGTSMTLSTRDKINIRYWLRQVRDLFKGTPIDVTLAPGVNPRFIAFVSDKGGVGKSPFARALTDLLREPI